MKESLSLWHGLLEAALTYIIEMHLANPANFALNEMNCFSSKAEALGTRLPLPYTLMSVLYCTLNKW